MLLIFGYLIWEVTFMGHQSPEAQGAGSNDKAPDTQGSKGPANMLPKPGEPAVLPKGVNQSNVASTDKTLPKVELTSEERSKMRFSLQGHSEVKPKSGIDHGMKPKFLKNTWDGDAALDGNAAPKAKIDNRVREDMLKTVGDPQKHVNQGEQPAFLSAGKEFQRAAIRAKYEAQEPRTESKQQKAERQKQLAKEVADSVSKGGRLPTKKMDEFFTRYAEDKAGGREIFGIGGLQGLPLRKAFQEAAQSINDQLSKESTRKLIVRDVTGKLGVKGVRVVFGDKSTGDELRTPNPYYRNLYKVENK
jgi:hypothetical protein